MPDIPDSERWHRALPGVAAALCEAGYPCTEEHDHSDPITDAETGRCAVTWTKKNVPPFEVLKKAFELCKVADLGLIILNHWPPNP
jgi:hypothetical protein